MKVTFNLVPSLLVQLEAFARDEARDRHLELGLKPAASLTEEERAFCVEHFFHAHRPRMIDPYPRYAELLAQRGGNGAGLSARAQASQFTVDDLRDLQVWHKLVWIDPVYFEQRRAHPGAGRARGAASPKRTSATLRAGRAGAPAAGDSRVPRRPPRAGRSSSRRRRSTTRFCRCSATRTSTCGRTRTRGCRASGSGIPRTRPSSSPARSRCTSGSSAGGRDGLWPSEGSVSDAMVPLVAAGRASGGWRPTRRSWRGRSGRAFTRDARRPRRAAGAAVSPVPRRRGRRQSVACGFRDHTLSDLIGFSYASWSADGAADDFVDRLVEAGRRYRAAHRRGRGDGLRHPRRRERLGALRRPGPAVPAGAVSAARHRIRSCRRSRWRRRAPTAARLAAVDLPRLVDQRRLLHLDRPPRRPPGLEPAGRGAAGARRRRRRRLPQAALAQAREEMLIAEGSDWFWWYGDDHSSDHDLEFDELFRRHVRNVYRALDKPIPEELFVTNITTQPPAVEIQPPDRVHPARSIDGEVDELLRMGRRRAASTPRTPPARCTRSAEREAGVAVVEFGFDLEHLLRPRRRHAADARRQLGHGPGAERELPEAGGRPGRASRLGRARLAASRARWSAWRTGSWDAARLRRVCARPPVGSLELADSVRVPRRATARRRSRSSWR